MSQLSRFFATSGPGSNVESLTGNIGGAVFSTGGNINVIGDGIQTFVTGNPGTSTLTITLIGSGVVKTLTGNTGGPISPTAGNINIVTANSIPLLAGAASTLTLDFALTDNLLLGSSGSITTGNTNVGYGKLAAASISSGSSNSFIGYESGAQYTTGSNSTAVGAFSMLRAVAGASNNTAIGYASLSNLAGAGTNNICVGVNSGTGYTTTENGNILIGQTAGLAGEHDYIRIGNSAVLGVPSTSSIFIGHGAGNLITPFANYVTGNIAIGASALKGLSGLPAGGRNIAVGESGLSGVTSGIGNISIGVESGQSVTTGASNIFIGDTITTGITTGTGNIIIGASTGASYGAASTGNILIGVDTAANENSTIRIGQRPSGLGPVMLKTYIGGINGVNVASTANVVTMPNIPVTSAAADQLGTAVITAGTNISVTPGANTITIAGTGAASFGWSIISVNQTAAVNNGYFCNKAGTLALALPATSAVGDVIEVSNINTALGVQFTQAAGQQIFIGNTSTTLGATGTLTSSAVGDALKIVCSAANTTWRVTSMVGNWTPA